MIHMEQTELTGIAGCGFSDAPEKNMTFAESLAAVREDRKYTISEMAQISRNPQRTLEYWIAGDGIPTKQIRDEVLNRLNDPSNPPSQRVRREAEKSHHLIWDHTKGWEMRVTVNIGAKIVGKRLRRRLKTRILSEAIVRRDLIVASYAELGLKIIDRKQSRWAKDPKVRAKNRRKA